MSLPNFSVKRPVTTVMIFLFIVLVGIISWMRLPQELYPPITYPQLTVVTFYKDAAPEEMEILITKLIEEAAGTVSGVRRISSVSKEETSLVIAEFAWGTNMDFAALGVREKIDLIKETLPRGSDDPVVMKFNPFELPVAVLNITATGITPGELQYTTRKIIKNELEKADGVASCNISGGATREILIEIDQDRMMSKGLAITDITDALSKANLNYPAGTVEEQFYEYLIRTMGEFTVVPEIKDVVVGIDERTKESRFLEFGPEDIKEKKESAIQEKRLIQLREIAKIKDTYKDRTSISRYNQKENISLSIQKQAGTNTVKVADNVKNIVVKLREQLPKNIKISIVYDQSEFIKKSLSGVRDAALQGGVLAFLVLFLFLKNARRAFTVALNIPISIIAVFFFMYFSGLSLNMISLGGLALGIGMLVDNGIVVMENISRYRQEGSSARQASVQGADEVGGAIAGSTLTTVAVFLPMIFVVGIAGQLFKELAFTVTFSLVTSLAVALAIIPLITSKEKDANLKKTENADTKPMLSVMQNFSRSALVLFLNNKLIALFLILILLVGSLALLPFLDMELLPKIDQGQFIIKIDMPPGTKLSATDNIVKRIENKLFDFPETKDVTVNIGSDKEKKAGQLLETLGAHQGQIIVNLKPSSRFGRTGPQHRLASTSSVLQRLKDSLTKENLEGANINYILQESVFMGAFQGGKPIVIEIKGQTIEKLREISSAVKSKIKNIKGIYAVEDNLVPPSPEIKSKINKERSSNYNLSVSDIAITSQTAIKGYTATKFKDEGEEVDITVKLEEADRNSMQKIRRLPLHSPLGIDIPLAEVAYFVKGVGPTEIRRQDQERTAVVSAAILNRSFNDASEQIENTLKQIKTPKGYSARLTGEKEQIKESFDSLRFALLLSILLVYMIMASQFESLWQPFVILFTIPLSLIGVSIILFLTNTPISIMVFLGLIVLGGIVVNNGIVLIDYINILKKQGMNAYEAVIKSSQTRLRPIIMTALTTISGLAPLALGITDGSELQQSMAITVIGGLAVSTFLSILVIPTIYMSFETVISGLVLKKIKQEDIVIAQKEKHEIAPSAIKKEEKIIRQKQIDKKEQPPVALEKPAKKEEKKPEPIQLAAPEPEKKQEKPYGQGNIKPELWNSLTERQQLLVAYLRKHTRITRKQYSDDSDISIPTAARDLKVLVEKDILVFKGPAGPGRYYILKENI